MQIFAALAEYDGAGRPAGEYSGENQGWAVVSQSQGKHIGRPAGLDAEKFVKVKKALEWGLSVAEMVSLTGISMTSVKRYRKLTVRRCD